jgi:hypothetical protein
MRMTGKEERWGIKVAGENIFFLGMGPIKNGTCFMNVVRRSVEDSVI